MQSDYQLIWFRQDLRIHDHAALWHATQTGRTVALVILSPEQWQLHDDAPIKIDFPAPVSPVMTLSPSWNVICAYSTIARLRTVSVLSIAFP